MATTTSDWNLPTWKLVFNAGTQLHGADSPYLWGPESSKNIVLDILSKEDVNALYRDR